MKKLMYLALALLFSIGVSAQDNKQKDHFVKMKDGKIWVWENGQSTQLTTDKTLGNGMMVNSVGTVTLTDGTTTMLKDGDTMDKNGVITRYESRKENKDMNRKTPK